MWTICDPLSNSQKQQSKIRENKLVCKMITRINKELKQTRKSLGLGNITIKPDLKHYSCPKYNANLDNCGVYVCMIMGDYAEKDGLFMEYNEKKVEKALPHLRATMTYAILSDEEKSWKPPNQMQKNVQ
ncbi:hypothetical protein ACHQM5_005124 [Ranunculus cassubicifolius]